MPMLTARIRALRQIPPTFIELLETFSSFTFFYISTFIIVMVFLYMGKAYYQDPMRLISLLICIIIYTLMSRSLRNALSIESLVLPDYTVKDKPLVEAYSRLTANQQPIRKIHADIIKSYLKSAYPDYQ